MTEFWVTAHARYKYFFEVILKMDWSRLQSFSQDALQKAMKEKSVLKQVKLLLNSVDFKDQWLVKLAADVQLLNKKTFKISEKKGMKYNLMKTTITLRDGDSDEVIGVYVTEVRSGGDSSVRYTLNYGGSQLTLQDTDFSSLLGTADGADEIELTTGQFLALRNRILGEVAVGMQNELGQGMQNQNQLGQRQQNQLGQRQQNQLGQRQQLQLAGGETNPYQGILIAILVLLVMWRTVKGLLRANRTYDTLNQQSELNLAVNEETEQILESTIRSANDLILRTGGSNRYNIKLRF